MKRKILVVDEDNEWVTRLASVASENGYMVRQEMRAATAYGLLESGEWDIAIAAYESLRYNGQNLLARIKALDIPTPTIVRVAQPGQEANSVERELRGQGADFFFFEPFGMNDLWDVCERLFSVRDRLTGTWK